MDNSKNQITPQSHLKRAIETTPFILAALTTALVAIFYSKLFFFFEENIYHFYTKNYWYNNLLITVTSIFLSWFLPYYFAQEAIGSGVPQMLAANELDHHNSKGVLCQLIGLKVIFFKILGSIICIIGGGTIGQEGPMLQISSGIFYFFGNKFGDHYKEFHKKMLILVGGGAGIAAAFNTPLGGIAFSLEELSKDHFNKIKSNVILAVIISGITVQTFHGSYLYLGYPRVEQLSLNNFSMVFIVSITLGFLGSLFGILLKKIYQFRENLNVKQLCALNIFIGIIFWALAQYLSTNILGAGKPQILEILFKNSNVTLTQSILRFIGPLMMALAGTAGGLFAPSLASGVVIATYIGQLAYLDSSNLLALSGMISFLTGFMRIPFTAFILIMEMTDRQTALVPMMIAALIAHGVSKVVTPESFYDFAKEKLLKKYSN